MADAIKVKFACTQLAYSCVECGAILEREGKGIWKHSSSEWLFRKSRCKYAGMRFQAPTIMLEPVDPSQ